MGVNLLESLERNDVILSELNLKKSLKELVFLVVQSVQNQLELMAPHTKDELVIKDMNVSDLWFERPDLVISQKQTDIRMNPYFKKYELYEYWDDKKMPVRSFLKRLLDNIKK